MTQNLPLNVCFLRNNILLTLKGRNLFKLIPRTYQHALFPSIRFVIQNAFFDIVCIGVSTPPPLPQKHHPLFLARPSFKSGICPITLPMLVFLEKRTGIAISYSSLQTFHCKCLGTKISGLLCFEFAAFFWKSFKKNHFR